MPSSPYVFAEWESARCPDCNGPVSAYEEMPECEDCAAE